MLTLFWIIDIIIWVICAYETFLVRSNSSMLIPLLIMSGCLFFSWKYKDSNPKMALYIAGAPAGLVLLFVGVMVLMLMFGRNNWQ